MGTYTANKELFMPTVGEQGWGTLMNGNLETIDTFLKPISLSGSTYTFTGNHVGNQSGGSISATSITNSGTLTNTGKVTANGGIGTTSLTTSSTITSTGLITANGGVKGNLTGNVTGNVTGLLFVKGTVGTSGDENYATLDAQSVTTSSKSSSSPNSITIKNYSIVYGNPKRHTWSVYTRRSDLSGTLSPIVSQRTLTFKFKTVNSVQGSSFYFYYKKSTASEWTRVYISPYMNLSAGTISTLASLSVAPGDVYQFYVNALSDAFIITAEVAAGTTYKVKYATP